MHDRGRSVGVQNGHADDAPGGATEGQRVGSTLLGIFMHELIHSTFIFIHASDCAGGHAKQTRHQGKVAASQGQ